VGGGERREWTNGITHFFPYDTHSHDTGQADMNL
jgi:hypothetical protein